MNTPPFMIFGAFKTPERSRLRSASGFRLSVGTEGDNQSGMLRRAFPETSAKWPSMLNWAGNRPVITAVRLGEKNTAGYREALEIGSLPGQAVDVRRLDPGMPMARQISPPPVIGKNEDDIGRLRLARFSPNHRSGKNKTTHRPGKE